MEGNIRGARDLRNVIRRNVEDKIADCLVRRADAPPKVLKLTVCDGEIALT